MLNGQKLVAQTWGHFSGPEVTTERVKFRETSLFRDEMFVTGAVFFQPDVHMSIGMKRHVFVPISVFQPDFFFVPIG